jgi:hypothetical protein
MSHCHFIVVVDFSIDMLLVEKSHCMYDYTSRHMSAMQVAPDSAGTVMRLVLL